FPYFGSDQSKTFQMPFVVPSHLLNPIVMGFCNIIELHDRSLIIKIMWLELVQELSTFDLQPTQLKHRHGTKPQDPFGSCTNIQGFFLEVSPMPVTAKVC